MSWQLHYYIEVETDLVDAKKWYKSKQEGLQFRFATEVENSLNNIRKNPFIAQVRYKQIRVAYLHIFPFSIHYYINEPDKSIIIIGIFHQHRNPETYYNR